MQHGFHLAGIVPVASRPLDFELPWSDCLVPLAPNFFAVERAILECAYAGCETIWVICNDDTTPIIRHRIGDFIQDPVWIGRRNKYPSQSRRPISIYYVPISQKDWFKQNCTSWSIVHGAATAYSISNSMSRWLAPKKYYVAFPHGVYEPAEIRAHRLKISDEDNVCLAHQGKTILDGKLLGFTFGEKELRQFMKLFKERENEFLSGEDLENRKEYFTEDFSLDILVEDVIIDKELELKWFYEIDSWDAYCNFLASPERKQLGHPGQLIISYREWNPIGIDLEEDSYD